MATDREAEVPDPDHPQIVRDHTFGGEPRIRGRRITVLDVYEQVQEGAGRMTPEEFSDTFRLDVAAVYAALAYYHSHEEEMERYRQARSRASENLRARVDANRPSGTSPDQ